MEGKNKTDVADLLPKNGWQERECLATGFGFGSAGWALAYDGERTCGRFEEVDREFSRGLCGIGFGTGKVSGGCLIHEKGDVEIEREDRVYRTRTRD